MKLLEPARFSLVGMTVSGFGESTPPGRDFTNFYQQDAEDGVELMKILGFSKSGYYLALSGAIYVMMIYSSSVSPPATF